MPKDVSPSVIRRKLAGFDLVTIPLADYVDLLACKRQLSEASISHRQFGKPSRAMVDRNPEVAVFLVQKFGLLPMREILRQCRRRFGKAATPSQSTAYRYWQAVRREMKLAE